jgi:hypothetical protein
MQIKPSFPLAKYTALVFLCCSAFIFSTVSSVSAAAVRSGFNANSLPANDDGSTGVVPLGFSVDFFGTTYSSVYVNNNGNVTFNSSLSAYTPGPFGDVGQPIIAPFWADVDTRGSGSAIVRYGTGMVNSRNAFGVTWVNVGYFDSHFDKLNSFQLIIIDRSDRSTGSFDVEFNYDSVIWETGDASGGTTGLGGFSARAGFSDGTVNDFELSGSGVNGGFLNSNSTTGLINNSRNSTVLGRYVFEFPLQARVTKVEYEQINGGTSPMDENPNTGSGRRIYPDKDTPTDGFDRRKIRVKAQYGLNSAGVRIYFRNFDLDDPSASSAPIDDETSPTGNDNRGDVDDMMNTKAGLLTIPNPNPNDCQPFTGGVSCLTDTNGVATVDFTTTKQPGDNFTVVASANQTYLTELMIAIDGINLKDSNNVQTPVTISSSNNACATSSVRACRADMLTVWRRLHIEVDSMSNAINNNVSGNFPTDKKVGQGNPILQLDANSSLQTNRFENGRLFTDGKSYQIRENTSNTIKIFNNQGVFQISQDQPYTIYDDDDFNSNDGTGLRPLIGDEGEDILPLERDFLKDSDIFPTDLTTTDSNALAPAYIRPKYSLTGSGSETVFLANIAADTGQAIRAAFQFFNVDTEDSTNFWTAYLLSGYQYTVDTDSDPITEAVELQVGVTDAQNGQGSIVFFESLNPRECFVGGVGCDIHATKVHEIGHLLNADHGEGGLMDSLSINFSATSLTAIRSVTHP